MTNTQLFNRFRSELARGTAALYSSKTEVGRDSTFVLYYTPFEHENLDAELVVVGMTPGPTQLELCYTETPKLLAKGLPDADVLSRIKPIGAFGGSTMRPNLVKQLEHFRIAERLGLRHANELWSTAGARFHATSVVPHAAFHAKRQAQEMPKLFSGSFDAVLGSRILRECFEQHFLAQLRRMSRSARYIGLGSTPRAALRHAVSEGIVDASQVLGTFAHPSTSGGSRVQLYLREVQPDDLKSKDPALKSAAEYHAAYDEMARNVEAWRPLLKTAA